MDSKAVGTLSLNHFCPFVDTIKMDMWVKFVVGPTLCPKRFRVCSFEMIWIRISVI